MDKEDTPTDNSGAAVYRESILEAMDAIFVAHSIVSNPPLNSCATYVLTTKTLQVHQTDEVAACELVRISNALRVVLEQTSVAGFMSNVDQQTDPASKTQPESDAEKEKESQGDTKSDSESRGRGCKDSSDEAEAS